MDNDDDMASGRRKRRQGGRERPLDEAVETGSGPAQSEPATPAVLSEPGLAGPDAAEGQPRAAEAAASADMPPAATVDAGATAGAETAADAEKAAAAPPWPAPAGEGPPVRAADDTASRPLDVLVEPQRAPSRTPLVLAALAGGVAGGVLVVLAGLAHLFPAPEPAAPTENVAPRLAGVEQDIASFRQGLTDLSSRLAVAETSAKGAADSAANAVNLAVEAKDAAGKAPAATPAPAVDLEPLTKRVDDLGQQTAAAAAAATQLQGAVQTDIAALQKRLAALEQAVSRTSPDRIAAYTVALSQLGEAIRSGRPFEPELEAATALGGETRALEPLKAAAAQGTPSVEALAQSFDAQAHTLIGAGTPDTPPPAPDSGVVDRLVSNFSSVVSVTRDNELDADEAAKPVKAVSAALHRGDLAAALAAFAAMPQAAQQAGAAWLAQAKASADAIAVVRAESTAALKTLSSQ